MPRPDLISQEYITPVSVTNFRLFGGIPSNGSARSDLVYCDLRPKPLSSRRKRFIVTNVGFFVLHLCAMLTLVLYMTIQQPLSRSAGSQGCELCDLWCASNCSQLTRDGDLSLTQRVINVNETHSGRDKSLCCVKRRDTLSTNYEVRVRNHFANIMDGWMDGWVDGWMGGWMDGYLAGLMDGWMDGLMTGWLDG